MNLKGTLLLLFLACSGGAMSQFKNIMLDEQRDGHVFVCSPTIAINLRNPDILVAGSVPDNVYHSRDGGKTWGNKKLSSSFGVHGDLLVMADARGGFYFFHLSDPTGGQSGYETGKPGSLFFQRSEDGGETWVPGESVGADPSKFQKNEFATMDSRGNIYATWKQFDKYDDPGPDCSTNILFSMSKNGKKWSDPVVISGIPGNCSEDTQMSQGAVPAVTFDGKVMIAWSNKGKIYLDRSFNGGGLWLSNDIVVAEQVGGEDFEIPGHDRCNTTPVLQTDKGKSPFKGSLYIAWADQRNGKDDTDIWFTRSHNFGDNWSSPMRINDDAKGKHQYLPWLTVDQETGYLYIVYFDRRNYDDLQTDVYLAYSTDGGASFKNVLISERSFTPQDDRFFGGHNSISAHKGIIAPVWTRMDKGKTSVWTTIVRHEDLVKTEIKLPPAKVGGN